MQHLFSGCASCWSWLGQRLDQLDPDAVPLDEPLCLAVATAALAQSHPESERIQWMQPLHAADARRAPGDPTAFCRLVLYEAMPAIRCEAEFNAPALLGLYQATREGGQRIATLTEDLLALAQDWLSDVQRHDLMAISLAYRAFQAGLGEQRTEADALLRSAYQELTLGSQAYEPKLIVFTKAAICARWAARLAKDERPLLQTALDHLRAAGDCLPLEGAALQKAEVLHDTAMVQLALENTPIAFELLESAWQLIADHSAEETYLGLLIRLGRAKVALAMARLGITQAARSRWTETMFAHLLDALCASRPEGEEGELR